MRVPGPALLLRSCLAVLLATSGPMAASALQGRPGRDAPRKPAPAPAKRGGASTELTRAERYFAICDYDADGWISYSEANASLGLDRDAFRSYDEDRDGRIIASEFRKRYDEILASAGVFLPPRPKSLAGDAIPERADDALETYDKNRDGGLDEAELEVFLVRVGAVRLEAETSMEQFDRNLTRELESAEIEDLLTLLKPSSGGPKRPRPTTLDELFGQPVSRTLAETSTPQPVRLSSPARTFRRLDLGGDGRISIDDLAELQRPLVLPVRARAVLAALDADGDGTVDEAEFRRSMRTGR